MRYQCSFYTDEDDDAIEGMILNSYRWEYPIWGLSRHEFSKGLHPSFTGNRNAWKHTVSVFREDGCIVSCVINEGNYDGEAFFLFATQQYGQDRELLQAMIRFAKTYAAGIKENRRTRFVSIPVAKWNEKLAGMLLESGFTKEEREDIFLILPFGKQPFEVKLPDGYVIADGHSTPDFHLSNVHRHAFAYGKGDYACDNGSEAFRELRTMKHYRKELELCVLDPQKMPVAFANIWYDEKMPYCELEPLAVVWWERRKGIGRAILHEAANRVMKSFPNCTGMLGGDQTFYSRIGYEKKSETVRFHWELDVIISWESESFDKDYAREVANECIIAPTAIPVR